MRRLVHLEPLTLIKILRPMLPGARLQQHLTRCAVYEVADRKLEPWLPPLRKRHVLGLAKLGNGLDASAAPFVHPVPERVH